MKKIILLFILFLPFSIQAQTHSLDLSVELRESATLGDKAEIWIKGMGSWHLNNQYSSTDRINKFGLVSKTTPKLYSEREYDLSFYPNGRDGEEKKVQFKIRKDFCTQGCTVYALSISVFPDKIKFFGKPIEEAYGKIEVIKEW